MIPEHARRLVGRTLRDKWTLDAFLGEGGNAMVFAATHRNGMRGAVKVLHGQHTASTETKRRLAREGYVANRIEHPGVVRVLDDDETDDGLAFIVMELLEGETCKQLWLRKAKALSIQEVLGIAAKVLHVLEAAHAAGVVHRDVKPDNVFLTKSGEVKLLDFGIAGLREGGADATQTGRMLGTPAFMSPEQALARWREVDARSDVFAVGATIRALLTGRALHAYSTLPELLVAAATRSVEPLSTLVPDAPAELAAVIDRAVAFRREDRWESAVQMRQAIEAALVSIPEDRRGVMCELPVDDTPAETQATILAALGEAPKEQAAADASAATLQPSTLPRQPASSRSERSDPSDPTLLSADPADTTSAAVAPTKRPSLVLVVGVVAVVGAAGALIGRFTSTSTGATQAADDAPASTPAPASIDTATAEVAPQPRVTEISARPTNETEPESPSSASVHTSASALRSGATHTKRANPIDVTNAQSTVDMAVQRASTMCAHIKQGSRVIPVSIVFHNTGKSVVSLRPEQQGELSAECVRTQMNVGIPPYDGPDYRMGTSVSLP